MPKRIQAGDTSEFAVALTVLPNPDEYPEDPAVAGSWGRFELWMKGTNLTEHRDREEGLHEATTWFSRPLVRWLLGLKEVLSWDLHPPAPLSFDTGVQVAGVGPSPEWVEDSVASKRDRKLWEWRQKHALSSARRGGVLPEVVFRRVADQVEVSWRADLAPSLSQCRFLDREGVAFLPLSTFFDFLDELDSLAQEVLGGVRPIQHGTSRSSLWSSLDSMLEGESRELVVDSENRLGPLGLALQGLDPELGSDDARALKELAVDSQDALTEVAVLDRNGWGRGEPWQQGHEFALEMREKWKLGRDALGDLEPLLEDRGIGVRPCRLSDPSIRSISLSSPDQGVRGVVGWNESCPWNAKEHARRASLLQGLGHLLMDRSSVRRVGWALGSAWAAHGLTARANAFATMMLAPPECIRLLEPTVESISEHSSRLGASSTLLVRHAANLGVLTEGQREELEGALGEHDPIEPGEAR